ncbi:MAG: hypothetical protein HY064_10670 [Bacteroidetes bacterium]|nr:hypothetical protein [Bacteroidota bacterium]
MKPYIDYKGDKLYLPQEVAADKFEMNVLELKGNPIFLLCPRVRTRYMQATGALMERDGSELKFILAGEKLTQASFPVGRYETIQLRIDHKAANATPVSMPSSPKKDEKGDK